ncbi:MAG: hypothetical protein A2504_02410 [Bdellovibrionales bacterium RIFOXYD12_FULL_39_22]|nr:MAG: hypothetical protein A2385_12440 [Bdellovibrionales bacterium RIFOXYB1_FULL_39_21]OFZ41157.1 MAG: hypothetical protein A2485_00850 [Bdellovibrionales bacterium RIFOXYC12_FULL_39_17]OFZ44911.1 MAG: hypothetical protein A2404_11595 [Bdellovibrionales bacterium RIFOXYC1_FULL_39_130]OFZ74358.1 MAG: hypothetical protein A2560_11965 [Bdellovibrionales bacterium RIFOXYD1_FULL_39_84]OFZ92360.1 MAG: hypothetical protein A2504_02410 [Bdellovibrionales bacterium RIFOXYD12_FULL_39_22]HLE10687.1 hy
MKTSGLSLLLASFLLFAPAILQAADYGSCEEMVCKTIGYDFGDSYSFAFPKQCYEKLECKIMEWDELTEECVATDSRLIYQPIQCRDIPPM